MPALRRTSCLAVLLIWSAVARGQGGDYKAEPLKEAPPESIPGAIAGTLATEGLRILNAEGKPFADVWLRKGIPATAAYTGPKGNILYPVLNSGELLGVVRYTAEGQDYRDQAIEPGVYTLRYDLQPVNGDHLGVSPYRDFALLIPAGKDTTAEPLAQKPLESRSAEAAGSNHPAVLMFLPAAGDKKGGEMVRDDQKNLWGVTLGIPIEVKGQPAKAPLVIQLVVVGAAPV